MAGVQFTQIAGLNLALNGLFDLVKLMASVRDTAVFSLSADEQKTFDSTVADASRKLAIILLGFVQSDRDFHAWLPVETQTAPFDLTATIDLRTTKDSFPNDWIEVPWGTATAVRGAVAVGTDHVLLNYTNTFGQISFVTAEQWNAARDLWTKKQAALEGETGEKLTIDNYFFPYQIGYDAEAALAAGKIVGIDALQDILKTLSWAMNVMQTLLGQGQKHQGLPKPRVKPDTQSDALYVVGGAAVGAALLYLGWRKRR